MTFRNNKAQDKKFEIFYNKHLKFLSKCFAENGKEKFFPNDSSFISYLINDNSDDPDFISFCRSFSFHVLMFPISLLKRNL